MITTTLDQTAVNSLTRWYTNINHVVEFVQSIIQPANSAKRRYHGCKCDSVRDHSFVLHVFKYKHSLIHHPTTSICINQYVEKTVVRYNTFRYHQINEAIHVGKATFSSIPMKQGRVGDNVRFGALQNH
ncbi:Os04g0349650 [Oryza sativa Japonica Group]|uniref:Os04g0349650 protein n=1 Tax=Oryza sativa subsp. japonica TaxID=39947 RepID=A0A0P0W907_ORYSJ|nr:hypothetical protein EE612_023270 [Oryza sativa]BAS88717.1 Os04g0349650 [Oryza sativa Japonica Group]